VQRRQRAISNKRYSQPENKGRRNPAPFVFLVLVFALRVRTAAQVLLLPRKLIDGTRVTSYL
jgi:hypothetical protein